MNKITIFAIVFASLAGVGLLGNLITLSVQPFGIFGSLEELAGSKCSCNDGLGNFAPENCEQFEGVYDDPNFVCVTLQPIGNYGIPPAPAQGCSASFWMDNSDEVKYLSVWPAGYSPDYYYNTMFQTSIQLSDLAETVNETNDEKEQENSEVFGINEVTSDVELPEETDEISSEEQTGEESVVVDEEGVVASEESVAASEETGEESVVVDEETGEESVVADEEGVVASEESVAASEETGEESVVTDEETGEESVVADEEGVVASEESVAASEETGEESVVADEETGEESVVADEEGVVASEESVAASEETGEESVVTDEETGEESVVADEEGVVA